MHIQTRTIHGKHVGVQQSTRFVCALFIEWAVSTAAYSHSVFTWFHSHKSSGDVANVPPKKDLKLSTHQTTSKTLTSPKWIHYRIGFSTLGTIAWKCFFFDTHTHTHTITNSHAHIHTHNGMQRRTFGRSINHKVFVSKRRHFPGPNNGRLAPLLSKLICITATVDWWFGQYDEHN